MAAEVVEGEGASKQSSKMLKAYALSNALKQANSKSGESSGVVATMVLTKDGAVLASAGSPSESTLVAAIASNIWGCYVQHGVKETMSAVVVDCDNGKVLVSKINDSLLLCMYCKDRVDFGTLKLKADAMIAYLTGPLSEIQI
eukprot:a341721_159.p2 GENE.a341721_159~~a341721_159.p2  ORF type:complete len:152 (-),score=54.41 a341721_159:97-525(-)